MNVRAGSLLDRYLGLDGDGGELEEDPPNPIVAEGLALMNQADDDDDAEAALSAHHCFVAADAWLDS